MSNYEYLKFDYETKLIDNRKNQITDVYENELKFANTIPKESTHGKMVAKLVVENANMKNRINDLLKENTEWKLENERLNNIINELEKYIKSKIDNVKYNSFDEVLEKLKELKEGNK